ARRPGRWARRAADPGPDHRLPWRVLRAEAGAPGPGAGPHLSGARSGPAVSWRAPHPNDRRHRPRWTERGAGAGQRGLQLGPDPGERPRGGTGLSGVVATGATALRIRPHRGTPVTVETALHGELGASGARTDRRRHRAG